FLEKLGVEPEIFRVGEYKSAVEPFIRMDSSPENSEQFESILDEAADTFASAVEEKTGLNRNTIDHLLETIPEDPVRFALEHRLIDKIATPDEVRTLVGERLGLMEDEEPSIMEFRRYDLISDQSAGVQSDDTEDAIALVYATGPILPEAPDMLFGGTDVITANTLGRTFRSIMEEGQIDGIVLYIDSPGGAATTSDLIWHQIQDIKKEIPVVAYLGNVAASGGYYMASAADSIVSSPSSITGSIGIYSILLNAHELFSDRLGIGVETFKSHEHADLYSISRQLTPSEQSALQHSVEAGYDLFLQRVADGRNMEKEEVNRLGRGRVWTGREAKEHRLVDRLGTLEDALSMTADMAELDSYRVITYPDRKPLLELLFGSAQARFTGSLRSLFMIPEPLNDLEKMLRSPSGIHWALLPVQIDTD
ncbi:MAG: signal peptide peptidase SppA, partial [Balneolaceae bacterium]